MFDTPFASDFRVLLAKHGIVTPAFAHGGKAFSTVKPQCLYSGPVYDTEELVAATSALVEGKWSVAGEHVRSFENLFSKYLGVLDSVMVNSGSSADLLLLAAAKARWNWNDGDEILVSPVGFPTTISAIVLNNLRPIFVDIEWQTLNASNDEIARKLREDNPKIKAVLVSPVLGNPPDIDQIVKMAKEHDIKILIDGCDSLGTKWRGKHLAQYADAATCSFFPSHHISTLQGGMISSNDANLISITRSMATWGKDCWCSGVGNMAPNGCCGKRFSAWLPSDPDLVVDHRYVFTTDRAYNLRPIDIQGALGCAQMEKLETIHEARRRAYYRLVFAVTRLNLGVQLVNRASEEHSAPSWFGFPFICPTVEYKRKLIAHFETAGIQTREYFAGNILAQPGYSHLGMAGDYPNAQQVLHRVFFIGTNPMWTEEHFSHIEDTIKSFKMS